MLGLTQRDPENTDWQRDLSVSHNHLGRVFEAQGKLRDALVEYEADLAIAERLTAHDPTNAVWKEDLLATQECIAELRRALEQAP